MLFLDWLIYTLAIIIVSYILPGVEVTGFFVALVAALVLGLINVFIKPIAHLLALPITLFTLGIFALVINALLVMLAAAVVPGFFIDGFFWAILFSVLLSAVNFFLNRMFPKRAR